MTLKRAHLKAKNRSKERNCDIYVVCDGEEGWDIASSFELDTFYLGSPVEAHYFCGEIQS